MKSKNFGFISGDDGKHYFFQGYRLNPGITVDDGDKVFFNIEQSEFGPRRLTLENNNIGCVRYAIRPSLKWQLIVSSMISNIIWHHMHQHFCIAFTHGD
jgi:cold shock CspA family protein